MEPVTACLADMPDLSVLSDLSDLALIIEQGGYDHAPYQQNSQEEQPSKVLLCQFYALKEQVNGLRLRLKKLTEPARAYLKAMGLQTFSVQRLGKARNPGQHSRRSHRSATKSNKSSSSSDSDGGPSASDSSDRCNHCNILCFTPLLHSRRCSSNKLTSFCTPASSRFIYSHALYHIRSFLSWFTFSVLRQILLEITTSYRVGVNHV